MRQDASRRKHEKMQADRSDRRGDDHGRRKRGWSPGYDEYEMQQQQRDDHGKRDQRPNKDWREPPADRDQKRGQESEPPRKKDSYAKHGESAKKMPGFGKFTWSSGNVRSSRRFEPAPASLEANDRAAFDQSKEESESKGKIAIKITGKTPYPARFSGQPASKPPGTSDVEKAVVDDLKKKVEALKRENALRNQLSSITIPARRHGANTAAVMMLGQRRIGKHSALPSGKSSKIGKNQAPDRPPVDIEADMSPPPPPPAEVRVKPPPPRVYEPPPPGEEDMDLGIGETMAYGLSVGLISG